MVKKNYDPTTDPANASYRGYTGADWPARRVNRKDFVVTNQPHSYVLFLHGQNPITEPGHKSYDVTKLKEVKNYVSKAKQDLLQITSEDSEPLLNFLNGLKERGMQLPYYDDRVPYEVLKTIADDFFEYLSEVVKESGLEGKLNS